MSDLQPRVSRREGSIVRRPLLPVTLSNTMAAADRFLPSALVGRAARRAIADITDRLPAALTRRTYLECRLAERAPRVDLVFCVDRASRHLLGELQCAWLPRTLQTHPLWMGLSRLSAHWADPSSRVGAAIYDLWLEFDAEEQPGHVHTLVPNVFVGLLRRVTTPPIEAWHGGRGTIEMMLGRAFPPSLVALGDEVVARLPSGANVSYVGVMYPRSDQSIRLCVSPLAGAALLDYLRAIGWPGELDIVADLLWAIPYGPGRTALEATTILHLDLAEGVQPRIGLEIPLPQYPRPLDAPAARDVFQALGDCGLCATAKHDALLRWPGYAMEQFAHQCWPSVALRRVSHVKIVHDPRTPARLAAATEAKTYLSYFHDFVDLPAHDVATTHHA
jgi:hypothetical protein